MRSSPSNPQPSGSTGTAPSRSSTVLAAARELWLGGILIGLAAAGSFPGAGSAPRADVRAPWRVITLLEYFDSGRQAVEEFVRTSDQSGATSGLAETIRRCGRSCVLLEVEFDLGEGRRELATASGVLLDGGRRILTAGHSVQGPGRMEIRVRFPNGDARPATVLRSVYDRHGSSDRDWALLAVADPPRSVASSLGTRPRRAGDLMILMGFPDEIGVDAEGRVAYMSSGREGTAAPLVTLATLDRTEPMTLSPTAGAIPTRGMSGGAVFDMHGELQGVFVSVSTTRAGDSVTHTYDACPTEVVRGLAWAGAP